MSQVYRCAYLIDHSSGVRLVNTFHVVARDQAFTTSGESAAAVRDALHSALSTKYRATMIADYTVQALVVREELDHADTSVPDEASATIGLAGTLSGSGDKLPVPVCTLVTFYTNAAVRSGHGRMFLPSPGYASALDGTGLWDSSGAYWTTALPAFLDELVNAHSTGSGNAGHDLSHVVYSRTRRTAGLPEYYFDVESYTKRRQPHWLRSRATAP